MRDRSPHGHRGVSNPSGRGSGRCPVQTGGLLTPAQTERTASAGLRTRQPLTGSCWSHDGSDCTTSLVLVRLLRRAVVVRAPVFDANHRALSRLTNATTGSYRRRSWWASRRH